MIPNNEGIVAYSDYLGLKCMTSRSERGESTVHSTASARNEIVNERLKNFSSLSHVFRHRFDRQEDVFTWF